jgi:RNA polymerase sigma-70 factor (ECF subfamily)
LSDALEIDLDRFHDGDEVVFAELVRVYSPRLRPFLRRYEGSNADANDLLQEVWLRAYRKRRTFAGRGSFFGWLLMVTRTVGLAAVGKRAREGLMQEVPAELALERDPEASTLTDAVRSAVLELPERQRDVVLLRLIEDRTTAETAALLHCAEGTVKATLHHAIRKLQALLKERVS